MVYLCKKSHCVLVSCTAKMLEWGRGGPTRAKHDPGVRVAINLLKNQSHKNIFQRTISV